MPKDQFMQEWLILTPGATAFDERVLHGLCIETIESNHKISTSTLQYLPSDDLPTDATVRSSNLPLLITLDELQSI
jgi:hypothetical protein